MLEESGNRKTRTDVSDADAGELGMMTRAEFVRAYAKQSKLSDRWADLGLVKIGDRRLIALPCDCGDKKCVGWAMLRAEQVSHHLSFSAPKRLREAYRECLGEILF